MTFIFVFSYDDGVLNWTYQFIMFVVEWTDVTEKNPELSQSCDVYISSGSSHENEKLYLSGCVQVQLPWNSDASWSTSSQCHFGWELYDAETCLHNHCIWSLQICWETPVSCQAVEVFQAANLLDNNTSVKDHFQAWFGDTTISTVNAVWWNLTLNQVNAFVPLYMQKLSTVLEWDGHKSLILSLSAYTQLRELIEVLDPFLDATRGEKTVTVSDCTLCLHNYLQEERGKGSYCEPLARALESSLKTRCAVVLWRLKCKNMHGKH